MSNGVPLVQITAPNAGGVSLNQYQRFDVPSQGVVLNNSVVGGTALLGAQAGPNPNLQGNRTAATIVNEVTSVGAPGVLAGTLEVFGAPASVIVANPNGVTCNGCGVVNTPRLTLSSGRIQLLDAQGQPVADFGQASRLGFEVQGGQIRITGGGVEGTVGRVELVGQKLAIDAPLRAHYLDNGLSSIELSAGTGLVTPGEDGQLINHPYTSPIPPTPALPGGVAIDASALGAMTAGQIRIVSTDAGLGVNLRGPLLAYQQDLGISGAGDVHVQQASAARDIRLDASGQLSVSGPLQAQGQLHAQAGGELNLAGPATVGASAQLQSGERLAVLAPLQVQQNLTLNAAQVQISAPTTVGGQQTVQASQSITLDALTTVGGQLSLQAPALAINAPIDAAATALSGGQLQMGQAGQTLNMDGDLAIDMNGPIHVRGALDVGGSLSLRSGAEQRLDEAVAAGGHMQLVAAGDLTLQGPATAGGGMQLQAGGQLQTHDSLTAGALELVAGSAAQLQGPVTVGGDARLQASGLTLQGPVLAGGTLALQAGEGGVNAQRVATNQDLIVHSQGAIALTQAEALRDVRLDSTGAAITTDTLLAGRDLRAQAATELQASGPVQAGRHAQLSARGGAITLGQSLHTDGDAQLSGQGLELQGAQTQGALQLDAGSQGLHSQGELIAGGALTARVGGAIDVQGTLASGQTLQAQAGTALNVSQGVIAGGDTTLGAQAGGVHLARVDAGGALRIDAGQDLLIDGPVTAQGNARLASGGQARLGALASGADLVVDSQGELTLARASAARDLQLRARQGALTVLTAGELLAARQLQAQAQGELNVAGPIQAGAQLSLQSEGGRVTLAQAASAAGDASVRAQAGIWLQGLQAGGQLHLDAGQGSVHSQGALVADGAARLRADGDVHIQALLASGGELGVQAGDGLRVDGDIVSAGNATLDSARGGLAAHGLQVGGAYGAQVAGDHQLGGPWVVQQGSTVVAGGALRTEGDIQIGGDHQVQAGGELLTQGHTLVLGDARLHSALAQDHQGPLWVAGELQAGSEQAGVRFQHDLDVGGALQLQAAGPVQWLGDSQVAGAVTVQGVQGGVPGSDQGDVRASVLNQGRMRLGSTLTVDTEGDFDNQGLISAPGDIRIQARNIGSNTTAGLAAGGILTEATLQAQASGQLHLGAQGTLSAGQAMALHAQGGTLSQGSIASGGALDHSGGHWQQTGTVVADTVNTSASLSNAGQMLASHIQASGATSNSGQMAAETISLAATTNGGEIAGRHITLGDTQNLGGRIGGQTIAIDGSLYNAALIGASGQLDVRANTGTGSGSIDNSGQLLGERIALDAQQTHNSGQIQASDTLSVRGGPLLNGLSEASRCVADADTCAGRPDAEGNPARPLTDADRRWSASPGQIFAGGALDIQVSALDNQGLIQSGADARIEASGRIANSRSANDLWTEANAQASLEGKPTQAAVGIIAAAGALELVADELTNTGLIQAGGALDIRASEWVSNQAPLPGLDGRLSGHSVYIQAQGLDNQGRIQASAGDVTLRIGEGGIHSGGSQSLIATPAALDIQSTGQVQHGAGGQWLADERIRVQAGGGLLNSGTLYGQQGAPQAIDIRTGAHSLVNTASGLIIAGGQLRIEAGGYANGEGGMNGGVVGSFGDATLITPGTYNPASDRLIAKGDLTLQTDGVNVLAGQGWASDAQNVTWSGTLLNRGSVELAGAASGHVENRHSGDLVLVNGLPESSAGSYWLGDDSASRPAGVTGAHVVAHTDVAQRAYFSAASLQGSLINEASDSTVGAGSGVSYTPESVEVLAIWEGQDAGGNTVTWNGPARSLPRIVANGPVDITLTTPQSGTIVGGSLNLHGGDLTLDSGLDPATGQPLVDAARQRQAQALVPSDLPNDTLTDGQVQAGDVLGAQLQNLALGPIDPQAAPGASGGDAVPGGVGIPLPVASSGVAVTGQAAGAAATATPRPLKLPTPRSPADALAALQSGRDAQGYQPQLPAWDQLRLVPGGITANELSLQLSGQFTNRSELQVQQGLDLKVAGGIDNQGAAIRAGGRLMIEGASLDNSQGLIESGALGHVRTTGGGITATQGQFHSSAGAMVLDAAGDIRLAGGAVKGAQGAALMAGGDIELGVVRSVTNTLTLTDRDGTQTRELAPDDEGPGIQYGQQLQREHRVSHEGVVIDAGAGPLSLVAMGDLHALGAELETDGHALLAGRNVTIEAAKDSQLEQNAEWRKGHDHYDHSYSETLVGGTLSAGQGVSVIANGNAQDGQGNITLRGAVIEAGEGQALLSATRDISVGTVHTEHSAFDQTLTKGGGFLSKKSSTSRSEGQSSLAHGSAVTGDTVLMVAGRDIEVKGSGLNEMKDAAGNVLVANSGVMGQNGTTLVAGRDVRIVADEHTASGSSYQQTTKSGLLSSGLSLTLGKQSTTTETSHTSTLAAGSSVGSVAGDTTIVAGGHYQQSGSQVLSAGGDVSIRAKTVSIEEAREIETSQFETRFRQSGLSVSLGGGVIDTATTVVQMGEVAARSDNTRTRVMAGMAAGLSAYNTASAPNFGQNLDALGQGEFNNSGLSLNISLGSSKSQSNASETLNRAKGSQVMAGGNVRIEATHGNVKVQGSEIDAGGTTSLIAKQGAIELLASADTHQEHNSSSSSASSIGMSAGVSGGQVGVNATVSASRSSSQGDGASTTYNNTLVRGGQGVHLESAGDTTLRGAVITAPQVTGDIGGKLHIESLQDTAVYDETGRSSGFSLSVPIMGSGTAGGSISQGKTQISSTYQSVGEQSGIRAGDGGFQLEVGGATTLKGGAITSTQAAVDEGKNRLDSAGGINTEDIQNSAAYSAKSQSLSLGFGNGKPTGSAGVGSDSANASSSTQAGVSGIAGRQDARTGDAETGLRPIFDKDKVKTEVQDEVAVSSTFNKEAAQAWGTYSNNQFEKARQSGDEEGMQCWGPTGGCRAAGHAAWGGLSGGAAGAAAAGGTSMMAPVVYQSLVDTGMPKELAQIVTVASSTVAGNAAGGASGAAAATNEAANNAVVAVPLIVEGVIAAGARAAHACVTSPACMNVVRLAGTAAVAKVVAIASESNEAGAPGYEAAQAPVNHTGNQSTAPNYAGTGTTTPNNGPATGSTTTTPAQQPGAGSNLVFNDGKLSDRPSQIADSFGVPTRDVRTAIENIKQDNLPRGGPIRNPDVYVDLSTGEVYPQLPGGLRGDSIGNLHDYLPRR